MWETHWKNLRSPGYEIFEIKQDSPHTAAAERSDDSEQKEVGIEIGRKLIRVGMALQRNPITREEDKVVVCLSDCAVVCGTQSRTPGRWSKTPLVLSYIGMIMARTARRYPQSVLTSFCTRSLSRSPFEPSPPPG